MPESDLVRSQDRAIEIFLQRLDDSDGAKAVAADEDGLGALGRFCADPFIEFARLDGLLVGWQAGGSGVNDLKTLTLKIARALLVHLGREPGRTDECEPCYAERDQCRNRRRARNDHGNAARASLEAFPEPGIVGGTAHIAAAGEAVYDRVQRSRCEQFGGLIDQWRVGEGAHAIVGDGRVHRSSRSIGPERNTRGVDRDSIRRHRAELRLRPHVGVRRKNANPCWCPTVRLPHGHLLRPKVGSWNYPGNASAARQAMSGMLRIAAWSRTSREIRKVAHLRKSIDLHLGFRSAGHLGSQLS